MAMAAVVIIKELRMAAPETRQHKNYFFAQASDSDYACLFGAGCVFFKLFGVKQLPDTENKRKSLG
jgi:hypothetical protein